VRGAGNLSGSSQDPKLAVAGYVCPWSSMDQGMRFGRLVDDHRLPRLSLTCARISAMISEEVPPRRQARDRGKGPGVIAPLSKAIEGQMRRRDFITLSVARRFPANGSRTRSRRATRVIGYLSGRSEALETPMSRSGRSRRHRVCRSPQCHDRISVGRRRPGTVRPLAEDLVRRRIAVIVARRGEIRS